MEFLNELNVVSLLSFSKAHALPMISYAYNEVFETILEFLFQFWKY